MNFVDISPHPPRSPRGEVLGTVLDGFGKVLEGFGMILGGFCMKFDQFSDSSGFASEHFVKVLGWVWNDFMMILWQSI